MLRVLAASPQTVDLLNKFTSVRIGDSSTIALPDELADQFPGCGGILAAGLAAMKIHLLWDFLTGSILQLRITPGRASDATNPIAQEVAPAGSLSLFDLGYFCLDRFQNLTRAGAFWISRCSMARRFSTPRASPCAAAIPAAADRVGTDRRVGPAGREPSPALPIDRSGCPKRWPTGGDRNPREAPEAWPCAVWSISNGRTGRIFVTNCEPELLTWEAVVVLYRARWQIELMFKLWKSYNRLAIHRAGAAAEEQLAAVDVKLIAWSAQDLDLWTATWCECRRSLMKAAAIIADWVTLLIYLGMDLDRLIAILSRMKDVYRWISNNALARRNFGLPLPLPKRVGVRGAERPDRRVDVVAAARRSGQRVGKAEIRGGQSRHSKFFW